MFAKEQQQMASELCGLCVSQPSWTTQRQTIAGCQEVSIEERPELNHPRVTSDFECPAWNEPEQNCNVG